MPKYFDPVNHPKKSVNAITLYPNQVILDGGGSGTLDISINGILNETIATYAGASYTTTATNWVAANDDFYFAKGFVVSNTTTGSASATIVVTPRYDWDTVNRIIVTAPTIATLSATFASTFEPDLRIAKEWIVTLGANTTVKYPKHAVEGDRIRLTIYNPSTYTVAWDTLGFFFIGGTDPTVTTTGYTTMEGVVNDSFYAKYDTVTLSGSSGTANVTAGGITRLATFNGTLDQTGEDFNIDVQNWHPDFEVVGLELTEAAGVLTFTATTKTGANHTTSIKNVSGNLGGTVATYRAGRILVNYVNLDIKQ